MTTVEARPGAIPDPLARPESPLTAAQARRLTDRVIKAGDQWFDLLLETWTLKAWAALKYHSWEAYATGELGMSVRNAYRVLDQGRVVQALQAAGVDAGGPAVSARQAAVLKGDPAAAAQEVAQEVAGGAAVPEAVARVVRAHAPKAAPPVRVAQGKPARTGEPEPRVVPAESKVVPARPKARPSRTLHPAEQAAYSLLGTDPHALATTLPRDAALRLAGELEAWLVNFRGVLRRAGASERPERPKCDPGKHPVGSRVGTLCGACGDTRAWPAK